MEKKEDNDLFFTCSLIEYISRKTNNKKKDIINKLGRDNIKKIYELAEVYHSENIDEVADSFINISNISKGNYDIINNAKYNIPTYFDIGKVYKRLIIDVNNNSEEYVDTLIKVLSSPIIEKIDNYNSSLYYESRNYLYECFKENRII